MDDQRSRESLLGPVRVLDLTNEVGLLCGKLLGDLGADVIKIEPPEGDLARHNGPFYKDSPHPERSLFWWYTNLNKRGITLNLETQDGRELLKRLVKRAAFVIESFKPGYLAGLGLGYDELRRIKPNIIMTSITPFGQTGPYAHYKASDLVGVAMGGMQRIFGDPDRAPIRISAPQFYFFGGLHGALGSMVAHYHRELTGEGQYVDVSCQQGITLALMTTTENWDLLRVNMRGQGPYLVYARPEPLGLLRLRYVHRCKDGYVLYGLRGGRADAILAARVFVEWANREDMALDLKDYDWVHYDLGKAAAEEQARIDASIDKFFLTKTKAELFKMALEKETQLTPINDIKDVVESPQLAARGYWEKVPHPELGEAITYPGWPVKMGEIVHGYQRRAPLLGEHNEDIYRGELGLTAEELVFFKARRVI